MRYIPLLVLFGVVAAATASFAQSGQSAQPESFGKTNTLDWAPLVFEEASAIDTMYNVIFYLTAATCVGVFVVLILFLVQYRHKPGRRAKFIHGNSKLEMTWTLIPTIILAVIAALSQDTWSEMKSPTIPSEEAFEKGEAIRVRIVGRQFKWYFHYPGKDGEFGETSLLAAVNSTTAEERVGLIRGGAGDDDFITDQMVVPVNVPVYCEVTSADVIHSFFLPNFRVKQDAVPGLTTSVWFRSNKTSKEVIGSTPNPTGKLRVTDPETFRFVEITDGKPFDIICAELCGAGHYTMRGMLYVVPQDKFDQWKSIQERSVAPAEGEEADPYG